MNQTLPSVSVILPVKNEEAYLQSCLEHLSKQTYLNYDRVNFETFIIDSESTDNTKQLIVLCQNRYPHLNITFLNDNNQSRTAALNAGILAAKNDIILRIDARATIPPAYIAQCVETLLQTGADNVGGVQKPYAASSSPLTQQAIAIAMAHPFGVGNAAFRLGKRSGPVDTVYLGCFWRILFSKIGLFPISAIRSEDSEMNYKIRSHGGTVYLNTDIIAYYQPRQSLIEFIKLYFTYGCARACFFLTWKTLTSYRQAIPPLCLIILGSLSVLSIFSNVAFYCLMTAVLGYLVINLIISWQAARNNRALFPILALTFPTMHCAWAMGFWCFVLIENRRI